MAKKLPKRTKKKTKAKEPAPMVKKPKPNKKEMGEAMAKLRAMRTEKTPEKMSPAADSDAIKAVEQAKKPEKKRQDKALSKELNFSRRNTPRSKKRENFDSHPAKTEKKPSHDFYPL